MELYKLKDNKLIKYNGGFIVADNRVFINPTEEKLREEGYKERVDGVKPEYDETTYYLAERYKDDGDVITVSYEVVEYEIPEEV